MRRCCPTDLGTPGGRTRRGATQRKQIDRRKAHCHACKGVGRKSGKGIITGILFTRRYVAAAERYVASGATMYARLLPPPSRCETDQIREPRIWGKAKGKSDMRQTVQPHLPFSKFLQRLSVAQAWLAAWLRRGDMGGCRGCGVYVLSAFCTFQLILGSRFALCFCLPSFWGLVFPWTCLNNFTLSARHAYVAACMSPVLDKKLALQPPFSLPCKTQRLGMAGDGKVSNGGNMGRQPTWVLRSR